MKQMEKIAIDYYGLAIQAKSLEKELKNIYKKYHDDEKWNAVYIALNKLEVSRKEACSTWNYYTRDEIMWFYDEDYFDVPYDILARVFAIYKELKQINIKKWHIKRRLFYLWKKYSIKTKNIGDY